MKMSQIEKQLTSGCRPWLKNVVCVKVARNGLLQLMYVSVKQKNFMLLVIETNQGLAYDWEVSFESFYDVIFVAMVTKILLNHTHRKFRKSVF